VIRRIAFVALFVAVLAGCNPKVESNATASPSPSPTSTGLALKVSGRGTASQPVRFTQQTGNRREYDLLARSFESTGAQGSARVTFKDVHVTFHGKDGSTLVATAPYAQLNQVTNTIRMWGGVQSHNTAGTILDSDTMVYDHATRLIHGTGHVQITSKNGFHATATKIDSDLSLTHTRMQ
jgi:LPS export ABC transporter protein LptC